MATSRTTTRSPASTRNQVIGQLKEDHKRVKKAYRDFQKLDSSENPDECEAIVQQVLAELHVHSTFEEECLYPAARAALDEPDLIDEAEVEHESAKALIEQLESMSPQDDKYAARFTVLCEYVLHHVKEEEGELFPQLERAKQLDWDSLAAQMAERRSQLEPAEEPDDDNASRARAHPAAGRDDDQAEAVAAGDGDEGRTRTRR